MRFSNVAAKSLVASFAAAAAAIVVGASPSHRNDKAEAIVASSTADDSMVPSSSTRHHEDKDDGTTTVSTSGSDAGILTFRRVLQSSSAPACAQGYVVCIGGFEDEGAGNPSSVTCATTCNGNCCVGTNACNGFMGRVCKDGNSCINPTGTKSACHNAAIPHVVNSCKGDYACYNAGKTGTVGNIVNSCTASFSCNSVGKQGVAGNIQNSCMGVTSCYDAGNSGTVGDIQCSCIGKKSFRSIGTTGVAGNIQNSCTGEYSCYYIGFEGATGNILSSCIAKYSCSGAGSQGGSVGSITSSCIAYKSCYNAGFTSARTINSNLNNCCNTPYECATKSEATIPSVCKLTSTPTSSPTTSAPTTSSPTTSAPTTPNPTMPTAMQPATISLTKSPVILTLPSVGGCPPEISESTVANYEPGDRVARGAIVFECKPWPLSLFCSQKASVPDLKSNSEAWKQAWQVIGKCTGTITSSVAGCPGAWTSGDMTKYKENDEVSVIKSNSPFIRVIYKCKAWPYSWYCGNISPLNSNNGGNLGWEYVGECTGTIGPSSSPTLAPGTVIIVGCPADFNPAKIDYNTSNRVARVVDPSSSYKVVYECREFPYSGYCNQKGFAPGTEYDYMAWNLVGPAMVLLHPRVPPQNTVALARTSRW